MLSKATWDARDGIMGGGPEPSSERHTRVGQVKRGAEEWDQQ